MSKKIEVKEYERCEQIVIVYELENKDDVENYNSEPMWNKIDLYDPMLKENSNCNIGYYGEGPRTLAKIIVETFRDYNSFKQYSVAIDKIVDFLAEQKGDIINFSITEDEVKHLL